MDRRSSTAAPLLCRSLLCGLLLLLVWTGWCANARAACLAGTGRLCPDPPPADAARADLRFRMLESAGEPLCAQQVVYGEGEEEAVRSMSGRAVQEDPATRVPPGLAFLMSAAIPGSGQLVEGKRRAFLYLGLEAFAWISHFAWKDAGNKKEGEYEAYARRHWDLDQWRTFAYGDVDTCLDALPPGVDPADAEQTLIEFIEAGNEQHYYEDIGKLEAYRAGWDDFDCGDPEQISANRGEYREMRSESNDFLERARLMTTIAFLNRIVSAVDAYRTARGAQVSVGENTKVRLGVGGSLSKPHARLSIHKKW
ncbi:MAG: hypothetical protein GF346_04645 [Candidatus Eisenbacteria bacterium]|nr:hypothetical protein [Candidatus Latescibacterota bacterium]MBD3301714.1 hypothetical protein [Candidatus Eisenbacteria bacterium]